MIEGNFHAALIFRDEEEYSKVQELSKRVIERALRMDGTCESSTGFQNTGTGDIAELCSPTLTEWPVSESVLLV